ncbi:hypothetical protein [Phaeobacter sp. C3_T13_0]
MKQRPPMMLPGHQTADWVLVCYAADRKTDHSKASSFAQLRRLAEDHAKS